MEGILRELEDDILEELVRSAKNAIKSHKSRRSIRHYVCSAIQWLSRRNCRSQCCGNGCEFIEPIEPIRVVPVASNGQPIAQEPFPTASRIADALMARMDDRDDNHKKISIV